MILYYAVSHSYWKPLDSQMSSPVFPRGFNKLDRVNDLNVKTYREKRLSKILITAATPLPFILGWSFVLGTQTYEVISQTYVTDLRYNLAMVVVPWIVSALNPVIYLFGNKSLRKDIKCSLGFRCVEGSTGTVELGESILQTDIFPSLQSI